MRTIFNYRDHSIVFDRKLSGAVLEIDGTQYERYKDGFFAQILKYDLSGEAVNPDGSRDQVRIEVRPGFLADTVTLFYNGREIENKQVHE